MDTKDIIHFYSVTCDTIYNNTMYYSEITLSLKGINTQDCPQIPPTY